MERRRGHPLCFFEIPTFPPRSSVTCDLAIKVPNSERVSRTCFKVSEEWVAHPRPVDSAGLQAAGHLWRALVQGNDHRGSTMPIVDYARSKETSTTDRPNLYQ